MSNRIILFLDFDGVLTSLRVEKSLPCDPKMWSKFDPVAISFLNKVCDRYPVDIVVCSTWRKFFPLHSLQHMLWAAGLHHEIVNVTPDFIVDKAESIASYLKDLRERPLFVVLDDDPLYEKVLSHGISCEQRQFIETDANDGILTKNMRDMCDLLDVWMEYEEFSVR